MNELRIEVAENGFVVFEDDRRRVGMAGRQWAFETAESFSAGVKGPFNLVEIG